jgi:hypothetical protein
MSTLKHHYPSLAPLMMVLFLATRLVAQTSIVVVSDGEQAVFGDDGLDTEVMPNGKIITHRECKIVQEGRVWFALAFLASESSSGFDAERIAAQAVRQTANVAETLTKFEQLVHPGLVKALRIIKREHPRVYRDNNFDKTALQIGFLSLENGRPVLCGTWFSVDSSKRGLRIMPNRVGQCIPGVDGILYMGQHDAIDRCIASNPNSSRLTQGPMI